MPGYELVGKEEQDSINEIFEKGRGVLVRYGFDAVRNGVYKVNEFEKKFTEYLHVKHALAVSSGNVALKVALVALGVKPGDEVITQSFTFVATAEAILDIGATPIFTEVDDTLTMDLNDLKKKITKKTKVIIPVHMYGFPCNMDAILKIAKENKIKVLEDAAQCCGGEYKGKKLGTIGDVGIISFDFAKIVTTGEGGLVITNNDEIAAISREYHDHGHENNPNFPRGDDTRRRPGFTYRMNELQGAVGIAQLAKLDFMLKRLKENYDAIYKNIKSFENLKWVNYHDKAGQTHDSIVFFMKNIENARKAVAILKERKVSTKNLPDAIKWHYAGTWNHMLPEFDMYKNKDLMTLWPKSTEILLRAVSIPVNIKMSKEDITRVFDAINAINKECA